MNIFLPYAKANIMIFKNSHEWIEQKGMTFDLVFGYSFSLFSYLIKRGKKKRSMNSKNRDQKSCLAARSDEGSGKFMIIFGPSSFSLLLFSFYNMIH